MLDPNCIQERQRERQARPEESFRVLPIVQLSWKTQARRQAPARVVSFDIPRTTSRITTQAGKRMMEDKLVSA